MRVGAVLAAVAVAVGVALIPSLPYGYYQVMRWVVSAFCVWLALNAHGAKRTGWPWVWGVVAGIYNPIVPVHANREVWSIVNIVTILLALVYGLRTSRPNKGNGNGGET